MCAVTSASNAYCWGFNGVSGANMLGVGNPNPTVSFPELVLGGLQWKMISVSNGLLCGIATTDLAYCWGGAPAGNSSVGRLGDGTRASRGVPTALFGTPRYRTISAGGAMGCGIDMSNDPWCWGGNNRGQLGDGSFVNTDRPGRVQTSQKFVSLVTGDSHACGLTAEGAAWCWGDGRSGELGQGAAVGSNVPVPVAQGSLVFTRLSALAMHTCAIATDRRVYCWGSNASNQLGFGGGGRSLIPLPVARPER
jgi:alpha-tubulin suppressor-like RCC1 family protein